MASADGCFQEALLEMDLLSSGQIQSLQVYRRHQQHFSLLAEVGESFPELTFSERVVGLLHQGKAARQRNLRFLPLFGPAERVIGCLVLQTRSGARLPASYTRQLTRLVSSLVRAGFTFTLDHGLRRILEKLVHTARPLEILRPLLLEMVAQLGARGAGLFVYEQESDTLRMIELISFRRPAAHLEGADFEPFTSGVPAGITPYWRQILENAGPFRLDANNPDHEHLFWPGTREWHLSENEPLAVSFPLVLGGRPMGFIGLTFSAESSPDSAALDLAAPFAQEATLALGLIEMGERAREQLRRKQVEELEKVNRTIQRGLDAIAAETNQNRAVGNLLRVLSEHLDCQSSALWLYDEEKDRFSVHLVVEEGRIVTQPEEMAERWPLERDIQWRRHIEERRPTLYRVDELVPRSAQDFFHRLGVKMVLGIPLFSGRRILGSFKMRFGETRRFTKDTLELVQALSHQATMALELIQLSRRAEELAVSSERNRLAGEIHDTVAQGLAGILTQVSAAQGWLERTSSGGPAVEAALSHLIELENLARRSLIEARRSLSNLQPLALTHLGLAEALQKHLIESSRAGLSECRWRVSGKQRKLPESVEGELFRIAQEAISNALRHSRADLIQVELRYRSSGLQLIVKDNGVGIAQAEGYGLRLMRQRAERIRAHLSLQTQPGEGTSLEVGWAGT